MSKLIFQLSDKDTNETTGSTIYVPERRSQSSKTLVMIKQRIGDFEQTIYAPIKKRRKTDD